LGVLELKNSASVVCSGIYERFFTGNDGKRYHHILELAGNADENNRHGGKKGYPAENGILSVTVIAASSMDADALSTCCFLLGYERGLALASQNGAEVLFIEENGIRGSAGAMAVFSQ
jgi:thiamine biosynthesis lipoprotein